MPHLENITDIAFLFVVQFIVVIVIYCVVFKKDKTKSIMTYYSNIIHYQLCGSLFLLISGNITNYNEMYRVYEIYSLMKTLVIPRQIGINSKDI